MEMKENQRVSLYLPVVDYEMLKLNCKERGVTMNGLIKTLIGQYLEEQEKKKRVCTCCGELKNKGLSYEDEFICTDCFRMMEKNRLDSKGKHCKEI